MGWESSGKLYITVILSTFKCNEKFSLAPTPIYASYDYITIKLSVFFRLHFYYVIKLLIYKDYQFSL